MKEINLTQDKVALVDDEDYDFLCNFKWCANKIGNTFYAATGLADGRVFHMHTLLLQKVSGYEIDHINRNGLDNRRTNIRLVTRSDNNRNSAIRCDNTTGVKGVYYNKANCNWYAKIAISKKWKYLGSFSTKIEAIAARQLAELGIGGMNNGY